MHEISVPRADNHLHFETLAGLFRTAPGEDPDRVLFDVRSPEEPGGSWTPVTLGEFEKKVLLTAKGFHAAGIRPGDTVGIMSRTRFEWTLVDISLWAIGAVVVPVYETSSADQVEWILGDSRAVAVVVESTEHAATVEEARPGLPHLRHVWRITASDLDRLAEEGKDVPDETIAEAARQVTPESVATIIYTSGTTGRPKGCELTHANFVEIARAIHKVLPEFVFSEGSATLFFLPLAHVLTRVVQVATVASRTRMGHSPDVRHLLDDLQAFRPTFLLGVPRVFEKIYNATDAKAAAAGRRKVFTQAARVAIAYSRALDMGRVPIMLRAQRTLFDVLVYSKIREALGGRVIGAVCGGAPLGQRLGHFYRGAGIGMYEGYGLTETTAPVCVATPRVNNVGTVGRPLPGVAVRITGNGEIEATGIGIFKGYLGNPEATAEMMTEDGWLRTGDIGSLDEDGCLTVTGRTKEVIVTAGGKNVYPAPLEDGIRSHTLVSQVMVVGDDRPFVAALVTLDTSMLDAWGKGHNRPDLTPESALTDDFVRARIQLAVDRANKKVSRAESIRRFVILPGDFTEENGMLTPSMKVKRDVVVRKLSDEIEAIYADAPAP